MGFQSDSQKKKMKILKALRRFWIIHRQSYFVILFHLFPTLKKAASTKMSQWFLSVCEFFSIFHHLHSKWGFFFSVANWYPQERGEKKSGIRWGRKKRMEQTAQGHEYYTMTMKQTCKHETQKKNFFISSSFHHFNFKVLFATKSFSCFYE